MYIFLYLLLFLFGASVASFVGVLTTRIGKENKKSILDNIKDIALTRSHCDVTGRSLEWFELIPVFSFLFLKGKCRGTNKKIPFSYFGLEIISGVATVVIAYFVGFDNLTILGFKLLVLYIFIYLGFYDFLYWEVPVRFVFLLLGISFLSISIGFIFSFLDFWEYIDRFLTGIGFGALIVLLIIASKGKGLGGGDVLIFALVGLLFGFKGTVLTFMVSVTFGSVFGIMKVLLFEKKIRGTMIQFIPFIALGVFFALIDKELLFSILFPLM